MGAARRPAARSAECGVFALMALSVAIFFLVNVVCLLISAHNLASALEEKAFAAQTEMVPCVGGCSRLWPIMVCLLPIGHTMMRGQVNMIVLTLLCAALASWIRGRVGARALGSHSRSASR